MDPATTTLTLPAGLARRPAVPGERDARPLPEGIAEILGILAILADYGRHLLDTIEQRAVWSTFATIAQFFGTALVPAILPRLQRGVMRAIALERVLRARAVRGRDLVFLAPRGSMPRATAAATDPASTSATHTGHAGARSAMPPPAASPPAQPPSHRPRRRGDEDEPPTFASLPTMAELEAEARRRPVGQSLVAICCDLGVAFTLCSSGFGDRLFDAIRLYRGSLTKFMLEMRRREKLLEQKHPTLPLPAQTREEAEQGLGFFVGDPLVVPSHPPTSAASRSTPTAAPAPRAAPGAIANAVAAAAPTRPP